VSELHVSAPAGPADRGFRSAKTAGQRPFPGLAQGLLGSRRPAGSNPPALTGRGVFPGHAHVGGGRYELHGRVAHGIRERDTPSSSSTIPNYGGAEASPSYGKPHPGYENPAPGDDGTADCVPGQAPIYVGSNDPNGPDGDGDGDGCE
jgi:hypothetical protein